MIKKIDLVIDIPRALQVTPGFLKSFLGGDPKGELQVFKAPIAFRPHYDDKAWGTKVKAENEDTTDEDGVVFVPVKNGEGIIMEVTHRKYPRAREPSYSKRVEARSQFCRSRFLRVVSN